MKKKRYLVTGVLAFAVCTLFNSCKEKTEFEGNNIVEAKMDAFDRMFVDTYGEIAPGHDWGFGPTSLARTRTADTNSNEWAAKGYNIPKEITAGERDTVMAYFRTTRNPRSETIDIHNYFIQNVGYTDTVYVTPPDNNGYTKTITNAGSKQMDWIFVGPGYQATSWDDPTPTPILENNGDDHVNNFNAGSGEIQHILYSGSTYFGFHDSFGAGVSTAGHGDNGKYCEKNRNFVIRFIEHGGQVDCYVGFNYESGKTSEGWHLDPDEYFSDRVIKLVPGEGGWNIDSNVPQVMVVTSQSTESSSYKVYKSVKVTDIGRVMAEDLGSSDKNDMDYNDVVFEARIIEDYYEVEVTTGSTTTTQTSGSYIVNNTSYTAGYSNPRANIKLLAAGGTIPIQVAAVNVHNAFGNVAKTTMINTYNPEMTNGMYVTLDPVDMLNSSSKDFPYASIDAIPIAAEYANGVIDIKNVQGQVPHKIRVPVTAPWPIERVEMNTAYDGYFGYGLKGDTREIKEGYVQNRDIRFWEHAVGGKVKNLDGFGTPIGTTIGNREKVAEQQISGGTTYSTELQEAQNSSIGSLVSGWTTVWTRGSSDGYLYNDGTSHNVFVASNQLSNVNVGTKVRIYGVSRSGWYISSTIGSASSYTNSSEGYVEFTLTNDNIKNGGLTILGDLFTVVRVDIQPATNTNTGGGGSEKVLTWSDVYGTKVYDKENFTNVKTGDEIRIYVSNYLDSWWQIQTWEGQNAGYSYKITGWGGNSIHTNNAFKTDSYIYIPIDDENNFATMLKNRGIRIQCDRLEVSSIKLYSK